SLPRRLCIPAHAGHPVVPLLVLDRVVVLATIRLIDGILSLLFRRNLAAPFGDILGQILSTRRILQPFSARPVLVCLHAARRCVDDEHTPAAGVFQDLVHTWSHLLGPPHGVETVMCVPHIA